MKKNISESLSKSLIAERQHVKSSNRFTSADQFLDKKNNEYRKKTIRDTFSIPIDEFEIISVLKNKLLDQRINVTKSEIVRMGLLLLSSFSSDDLKEAYQLINKIKVGRPKTK